MPGITALDIIIFVAVTAAVIIGAEYLGRITGYDARRRRSRRWPPKGYRGPGGAHPSGVVDASEQLRQVMSANFTRRRLLNQAEARVFFAAERAIKQAGLPWRVMAQVNLGEILSCKDKRAFAAINSKRVDILIITNGGMPIAAIEYQGDGHHQGTAAARDAVKKEALRRAGVDYIEVKAGDRSADLNWQIARLAESVEGRKRAAG